MIGSLLAHIHKNDSAETNNREIYILVIGALRNRAIRLEMRQDHT